MTDEGSRRLPSDVAGKFVLVGVSATRTDVTSLEVSEVARVVQLVGHGTLWVCLLKRVNYMRMTTSPRLLDRGLEFGAFTSLIL